MAANPFIPPWQIAPPNWGGPSSEIPIIPDQLPAPNPTRTPPDLLALLAQANQPTPQMAAASGQTPQGMAQPAGGAVGPGANPAMMSPDFLQGMAQAAQMVKSDPEGAAEKLAEAGVDPPGFSDVFASIGPMQTPQAPTPGVTPAPNPQSAMPDPSALYAMLLGRR